MSELRVSKTPESSFSEARASSVTSEIAHKIVLGLDFGTTYTGVAYGTTAGTSKDVEIVCNWPGASIASQKVPSRIAYEEENVKLNSDKWGFEVTGRMSSYSWFKLLLDSKVDRTKYDDASLFTTYGGILQLPDWRTPRDVVEDFLGCVCEFVTEHLTKRFTAENFRTIPVEVWITVPAIWSEAAKDQTRAAAMAAGFGSRPGDSVKMITEPEAAALDVLRMARKSPDPIAEGETFMVCDCGGGTVDLTTYVVESCKPVYKFQEVCAGEGGKCGGSFVDRKFDEWMSQKFGRKYTDLGAKHRSPGSAMMESFERAKLRFEPKLLERGNAELVEIENVKMDVDGSDLYDRKESTVSFPWKVMQSFFDPVVNKILELVKKQVREAKKKSGLNINRIVLVGGFGDSRYVNRRLRYWCQSQDPKIKLLSPPDCQGAIMKGAVIRGLEGLKPNVRISRHHYGFGISLPFREGKDRPEDMWVGSFDRQKMAYNRMCWALKKGQKIPSDFMATRSIQREILPNEVRDHDALDIFTCSTDHAPDFEYTKGMKLVGTIQMTFNEEDMNNARSWYNHRIGKWVRVLYYDIHVNMSADEGYLTVKVMNDKREMGAAVIEFHQED
ncbi:hsp70-like protein [Phyllosticta capitalensis]